MSTPPDPVTPTSEPALYVRETYTFSPDVQALLDGQIDTTEIIEQAQINDHFSIMSYAALIGLPQLALSQLRTIIDRVDPKRSKFLYTDLARNALSLSKAKSKAHKAYDKWVNVVNTINPQVDDQNTKITQYNNNQVPPDQSAINAVNQAINDYNAGLIDAATLTAAIDDYNTFVTTRATAPSEYTDYEASVNAFNAQVAENNEAIASVNKTLSKIGEPPLPLQQEAPHGANLTTITLPIPLPAPGAYTQPPVPVESALALMPNYALPTLTEDEFVKDIEQAYKKNDDSLLNAWRFTSKLYDLQQAFINRTSYFVQGSHPQPTLPPTYQSPKTDVGGNSGSSVGLGSVLSGKKQKSRQLSLEVSTSAYTSFANILAYSSPRYVTAVENTFNTLLVSTALSSAIIVKEANLPVGSQAEALARSQEFTNGINEVTSGDFLEKQLKDVVAAEDVQIVAAALRTSLGQFAAFQASVALSAPGLLAQILSSAAPEAAAGLAAASIEDLFQQTLADPRAVANVAAQLAFFLTNNSKLTTAQATAAVKTALDNFFTNAPLTSIDTNINAPIPATNANTQLPSINTFPQVLQQQFAAQGLSAKLATELALQGVSAVLDLTPVNGLSASDLNLNPDLGAINLNTLLAPTTVQRYVQGLQLQKRDTANQQVDLGVLSNAIKKNLDEGDFQKVRDVRNAVVSEAYKQGLELNDSIILANALSQQVINETVYSNALTADVIDKDILKRSLTSAFNNSSIQQSQAVQDANAVSDFNQASIQQANIQQSQIAQSANQNQIVQNENAQADQNAARIANDLLNQSILFGSEQTFRNNLRDIIARSTGQDLANANAIAQSVDIGLIRPDSNVLSDIGVSKALTQDQLSKAVHDRVYNQLAKSINPDKAEAIADRFAKDLIGPAAALQQDALTIDAINRPGSTYNILRENVQIFRENQKNEMLAKVTEDFRQARSPDIDAFVLFSRVMDPGTALLHSSATGIMYENDDLKRHKASVQMA